MTQRLAISFVCALALSCAPLPHSAPSASPAEPQVPQADLSSLRKQRSKLAKTVEELLREQEELVWKSWTQGTPVDLAAPYEGREGIFTDANVKSLAQLQQISPDPAERRAALRLRAYLAGEILSRDSLELSHAVENLRASMTFSFEGKEVSFHELDALLTNEPRPERRRALFAASLPAAERLGQLIRHKEDQLSKRLLQLGYPSYLAFSADLREADLARMGALASRVLELTDATWHSLLEQLAAAQKLTLQEVSVADFHRLLRLTPLDAPFPKTEVLSRAENTLHGMGLAPRDVKTLRVDDEERTGKNPRALSLPVVVPTDERVSVWPAGGAENQAEILRELGRMLPYALSPSQPFELQKLGSGAIPEASALLFEGLLSDPTWLVSTAGVNESSVQGHLASHAAQELLALRLDAAYLLYELQLRSGDLEDPSALYKALVGRAYGITLTASDLKRADAERSDFLAPLEHFRSILMAGELNDQLRRRFGDAWWQRPEAGAYLRTVWARGNGQTADELVQAMGGGELDAAPTLNRLNRALQSQSQPPSPQPSP